MNLIKLGTSQLNQSKEVPGLLACQMEYEIKSGQGRLQYTGPKFTPAMWHQVLSFFRWTHKEMNSESQVRLYVNTKLGCWGAWAFPQEARTGLSAREITVQETPEQALARFASWNAEPSGDWLYFCTVHHHCSAGAFQSRTDEENEQNQDGLHLTVGRMEAERHDLHARFYLQGHCFEPDLSLFWPVEPALAAQLPAALLDGVARFQMGEKVVVDFPEAWRNNVIENKLESKPVLRSRKVEGHLGFDEWDRFYQPEWMRAEQALQEISQGLLAEEDFQAALQALAEDPALNVIVETCLKHQISPGDLLEGAQQHELD